MKGNSSKTKSKRSLGGFTLVELIVVIAVLAILAGVGAVAYNGYIEYAKKGQDRATVGEIMHALELANYSDPGAVTSTRIFFTADQGICAPEDVSGNIKKALEDAFGEGTLENTKPSSSDWKDQSYTFDLSNIQELLKDVDLDTLTSLSAYRAATANGNSASFAGNVDELWGTVEDLVDMINSVQMFKDRFGDDNVKNAVRNHNNIRETVIDTWTSTDGYFDILNMGGQYAAANLARNYSFVNYALKHPSLTEDMKKTLEKYSEEIYDDSNGGKIGHIVGEGYTTDGTFSSNLWKQIKNDYVTSGQANIDALAYMGMLDVAEKVMPAGDPTDSQIVENFKGYTDSLSAVLANSSLLDTIDSALSKVSVSGNGICIKVTKMADGSLRFDCDPPSANPNGGEESAPVEGKPGSSVCEQDHSGYNSAVTLTFTNVGDEYTTSQVITLCSKDENYKSCTVTITGCDYAKCGEPTVEGPVTFDKNTGTLTATGTGTATVKITQTIGGGIFGDVNYNYTFTVNVH